MLAVYVSGMDQEPPKVPKMSDVRSPPISDPRWAAWSKTLLEFLGEPRTWGQIHMWRKKTRINGSYLRHCLAWLEEQGFARSYYEGEGKTLTWVSNLREPTEPS